MSDFNIVTDLCVLMIYAQGSLAAQVADMAKRLQLLGRFLHLGRVFHIDLHGHICAILWQPRLSRRLGDEQRLLTILNAAGRLGR